MSTKTQVILPDDLLAKAEERARSLGVSVNDYVNSLVKEDVEHQDDPWYQPLSWEVEKQYLLNEIEYYEMEKISPQKAANTAEELVNLLDQEIQHGDLDETD